jgi:hypothetical protein
MPSRIADASLRLRFFAPLLIFTLATRGAYAKLSNRNLQKEKLDMARLEPAFPVAPATQAVATSACLCGPLPSGSAGPPSLHQVLSCEC